MKGFIVIGIAALAVHCASAAPCPYLDLIEKAVRAYDDARMEEYTREVETGGVGEHGFPRLAANLALCVAEGRLVEKKPLLDRMLSAACADAAKGKMPPRSGGNEFSVRELVSAVIALERAQAFPAEKTAAWKADLAKVDASRCYTLGDAPLGQPVGRNWLLFAAASEQARIHYGLGGDAAFVERWVADQLRHFDRNGMYRDPNQPAVYDFISRMLYMAILHYGYDGPCRGKVEEELIASAGPTLAMLSVSGEFPYGGRSNQFLHNQTLYAAVAEWYAAFFARRGDDALAARFRSAADLAISALAPWLPNFQTSELPNLQTQTHVKNRWPKPAADGKRDMCQQWFGCENYAYFDKYMVTMGSWAALAREFQASGRPNLQTSKLPNLQTSEPPTFQTSEHFHWRFTHSAEYTVQEDWNANTNYDATGIGRIHRRGAPPAICLSAPFAEKPNYYIGTPENRNLSPLAIAGWSDYKVTDYGVELTAAGRLTLPAFEFDGERETRIEIGERLVKIFYDGWVCRYATKGGRFVDTGLKYFNRNGRYRRIDCEGKSFSVFVTIEPMKGK